MKRKLHSLKQTSSRMIVEQSLALIVYTHDK